MKNIESLKLNTGIVIGLIIGLIAVLSAATNILGDFLRFFGLFTMSGFASLIYSTFFKTEVNKFNFLFYILLILVPVLWGYLSSLAINKVNKKIIKGLLIVLLAIAFMAINFFSMIFSMQI